MALQLHFTQIIILIYCYFMYSKFIHKSGETFNFDLTHNTFSRITNTSLQSKLDDKLSLCCQTDLERNSHFAQHTTTTTTSIIREADGMHTGRGQRPACSQQLRRLHVCEQCSHCVCSCHYTHNYILTASCSSCCLKNQRFFTGQKLSS